MAQAKAFGLRRPSGPALRVTARTGSGCTGLAETSSATALKTKGKAVLSGPTTSGGTSTFSGATTFARSGRLTILAGRAQVTKSSISLGSSSFGAGDDPGQSAWRVRPGGDDGARLKRVVHDPPEQGNARQPGGCMVRAELTP
jgi:hypothetical protein